MTIKTSFYFILICFVISAGCKKLDSSSSVKPVTDLPSITIQALKGVDQIDTVGSTNLDSIFVKINEPGSRSVKFFIEISQQTRCGDIFVDERIVLNGSIIRYKWNLSGTVGKQLLKFVVLDSLKKTVDSINIIATALPNTHGWHKSPCITSNGQATSFAKMSTGRLLVGFRDSSPPLYSDDNGNTWYHFTSYYFGYTPGAEKILVLPSGEIFIASTGAGVFYSHDNGHTWTNKSNGMPINTPYNDLAATPDGKLIFTSDGGGIFMTDDKGNNWSTIRKRQPNLAIGYKYMATQSNGDIYFIKTAYLPDSLVILDHITLQLYAVKNIPHILPNSFFIDKAGNTYIGGLNLNTRNIELYQSVDNGNIWTNIFSYPQGGSNLSTIENISLQSDGNYYFAAVANDVTYFKTVDFKTIINIPVKGELFSDQYIVAANNNFIVNTLSPSISFYVP